MCLHVHTQPLPPPLLQLATDNQTLKDAVERLQKSNVESAEQIARLVEEGSQLRKRNFELETEAQNARSAQAAAERQLQQAKEVRWADGRAGNE